jgi:hypothetical protein
LKMPSIARHPLAVAAMATSGASSTGDESRMPLTSASPDPKPASNGCT